MKRINFLKLIDTDTDTDTDDYALQVLLEKLESNLYYVRSYERDSSKSLKALREKKRRVRELKQAIKKHMVLNG